MKLSAFVAIAAVIGSSFAIPLNSEADTLRDKKQKAAGFLAQTMCAARRYDYDKDTIASKLSLYAEIKGDDVYSYFQDAKVIEASNLLSLATTPNCTGINQESSYFKRAMVLMQKL